MVNARGACVFLANFAVFFSIFDDFYVSKTPLNIIEYFVLTNMRAAIAAATAFNAIIVVQYPCISATQPLTLTQDFSAKLLQDRKAPAGRPESAPPGSPES
jgi:hypothetical protein